MRMQAMLFSLIALTAGDHVAAGEGTDQAGRQAKPKRLRPFKSVRAKWLIRGRIRPRFMTQVLDPSVNWRKPNILIYVDGLERRWSFPRVPGMATVRIDKEGQISPSLVCVRAGQQVRVKNASSGIILSTRYPPVVKGLKRVIFGERLVSMGQGTSHSFTAQTEETTYISGNTFLPIRTKIHVLPHPVFTVVDADGTFALPRLPNGEYVVVVIHETLGTIRLTVKIDERHPKPLTNLFVGKRKQRGKEQQAPKRK